MQVWRVSHAVGEFDDAGVVCEIDGPDFDLRLTLAVALRGLLQGGEKGGPRFLAFGGVPNCKDQAREAQGEKLGGGMVAKACVGAGDDTGLTGERDCG